MAVSYDHCAPDHEVHQFIQSVVFQEFPIIQGLSTALVVKATLVHNDEKEKPALKKNGIPVPGIITIVGEKDRDVDGPDVLLRLDREDWNSRSDTRKRGLLSSYLRSLEFTGVLEGEAGSWTPLEDSLGRPKVKIRPADFAIEGYLETIKLHGENSPEKEGVASLNEILRQKRFAG